MILDTRKSFEIEPIDYNAATFDSSHDDDESRTGMFPSATAGTVVAEAGVPGDDGA
jgi:hypothetical protein